MHGQTVLDRSAKVAYWTLCFPRAATGDFGYGPDDPLDFDVKWMGAEGVGSAGLCGGGRTLLHWAARFEAEESIKVLLAAGADLNAKSTKGKKPLDVAEFYEAKLAVRMLLGAKPELTMFVDAGVYNSGDVGTTSPPRI